MKKRLFMILSAALLLLLAACTDTDVVRKFSHMSFEDITGAYPSVAAPFGDGKDGFVISADGETFLHISADFSAGTDDIVVITPLAPFINAGLDVTRLGGGLGADDESLSMTTDFGSKSGKAATVADALFAAVDADRSVLSYHEELDHYVIALSAGKFEFAKDHRTNDKDLVFILDAALLKQAGVDVNAVEGWVFAKMDGMQLLLKPFELL